MNTRNGTEPMIDSALWRDVEVRKALARRDLGTAYRFLGRRGISQRQIGELTGQAQSEVSEIMAGRQVMAYELLLRIAEGLNIPRGYLGLTYDQETAALIVATSGRHSEAENGDAVREFIAHAAQVTMGTADIDVARWLEPVPRELTPGRSRIGMVDVEQLESITAVLRALDARNGGGSCRDAVLAQVTWAQQVILRAECAQEVDRRRHLAIADLHNLAGWVSFDIGLYQSANLHYQRALEQARYADSPSLVANILYRMGRLCLHQVDTAAQAHQARHARNALKLFQLGQIAAQDSGCDVTVSMLCANEASAYAALGDERLTLLSLGRAQDEFARADPAMSAKWVRFFGAADLDATTGVARATLARQVHQHGPSAIEALSCSIAARGNDSKRSQAFELAALATVHLLAGDVANGSAVGVEAVRLAEQVRSTRVADRLGPVRRLAQRYSASSDCQALAHRIAELRAA